MNNSNTNIKNNQSFFAKVEIVRIFMKTKKMLNPLSRRVSEAGEVVVVVRALNRHTLGHSVVS